VVDDIINLVSSALEHKEITHLKNELTSSKTKLFSSEDNSFLQRTRGFSTMLTKTRQ